MVYFSLSETFLPSSTPSTTWSPTSGGWGQSFHFSPSFLSTSHKDQTRLHEERVVHYIHAKPSQKFLNIGCGIGGLMRAIAEKSGSNIVGIPINEYQVDRVRAHNKKAGLHSICEVVCGNFLQRSFQNCTFDGDYAIEATCHSPKLEDVYSETFRVLKPSALFVSYEWVTTEHMFYTFNPTHPF